MSVIDIGEVFTYVEDLIGHGKTSSEALDHAFHKFGIDRDEIERGLRSSLTMKELTLAIRSRYPADDPTDEHRAVE